MTTTAYVSPWLMAALCVGSMVACGEAGDSPTLVKDLRILAIAADPPEVLFDKDLGYDSPQVVFSALVAEPQGSPHTFTWRFCPVESDEACMNFPAIRQSAPEAMRPMLDSLFAAQSQGQTKAAPTQGVGGLELAPFASAWPSDLFAYHMQASGLGLGNGAWPGVVLAVSGAHAEVIAHKRITLNARDLAQYGSELQARFGFRVCTADDATAPCLPLRARTANKNPAIDGVGIARGKLAGLPFEPLTDVLVMKPGETVRINPVLSPEAYETYQSVQSALQDSRLVVEEQKERPTVSWFTTAGEFGSTITAAETTKTLDNTYTAAELGPGAGPMEASVWMVVRDLRGGVGWRHLRVLVTP